MGNCLKTQLKAVVNNDNLVKMDEILFVVPKNTNNWVRINNASLDGRFAKFTLVSESNSVYFTSTDSYSDNLGKEIYSPDNVYIKNASSDDVLLRMDHKERIKGLFEYNHQDNVRLADSFKDGNVLQYLPMLDQMYYHINTISSKNLAKCNSLTNIHFFGGEVFTDFNDIKNMPQITQLEVFSCPIIGNLTLLSSLTNLTSLLIRYCTGTSGTLESFLEGLLTNGKTTDIDCFIYENTNPITFNGTQTQYNKHYIVSFGTNSITVKIDNNVIGTFNGSTWTYNS